MENWDCLPFWRSQEWIEIQEKLDALDRNGHHYNPRRELMFAALDATPYPKAKVVVVGQDPYPQGKYASGIAFSIPQGEQAWPATLCSIIREYCKDLGYTVPTTGNLEMWCEQGVLLLNACITYQPVVVNNLRLNAHYGWKWNLLIEQILQALNEKTQGVVFVFLGAKAREFEYVVDDKSHPVIFTSHPSPLGSLSGRHPFTGSRIFTKINDHLTELKHEPINWKLPGSKQIERD